MDQDKGMIAVEPCLACDVRREDVLDRLEFAKVVAAADAAERSIEGARLQAGVCECALNIAFPGLAERVQTLGQLVESQLARADVEFEQTHAAADVGADQLRMNPVREDSAAHWAIFARMKVRHGRDGPDPRQCGDLLELK